MAEGVISSLNQVNAQWLTSVLIHSGGLESGAVASYAVDTNERELSTSVRLKVTYAEGSRGAMPTRLFLKLVKLDMEDEFFGPSEVNYYVRDYAGVEGVPIPRCYDAVYSEGEGCYHVLMDDLSTTHVGAYERTPTLEHGQALAEGLAAMHAHWWGKRRLDEANAPIHNAEHIKRFVAIAQPGAGHIIDGCADQLKPHWIDAINTIYEKHPPLLIERTADANGFTLIHGDTNLSNILVPIEGYRPLYIIDRQPFNWSLTTWLGVYDLAYTMVLKWDSDIRRALEIPVLKHYHEQLIKRGVSDYSWERLFEDYRLLTPMAVYVSTEWCRGALHRETMPFWMPMLQRSMTAFDDLNCASLW